MDKTYDPTLIEESIYKKWEAEHYFEPKSSGVPFCIMLPPPNVTGSLHMGHGFQHTLIDATIRYQRMQGMRTLWQPGTDHAGISTQLVVEGQLERQGISRTDLSRKDFVERIWQWKAESGGTITKQMRRLGTSVDWTRERFTLDEGISKAVMKVFIQLYEENLIYRGARLVNWDPELGTAISDLEVITEEEQGHLWHIRYPLAEDNTKSLIVATTRPETMLGDMAVAVHPEDERYKHLIGQLVTLPLTNRTIPVIADEYVDPAFGSGCVKITPAHDFNDNEVAKRHNLSNLNILNKNATLNEQVPKPYQNLDRFVARQKIIADLQELNLVEKIEPHTLRVPRGEKSGVIIEPLLTEQWYVRVEPLAKPAINAVKNGQIKFIPENWNKTYFQWMENIQDWCISRQLWWGHRIPAWYDSDGHIYVGHSEQDVRFKYKLSDDLSLKQDEDVLDTWFSSALWPFATLGWPEQTEALRLYYPTTVLFTGFDIIFFWVARMIMMGLKFTGKIPFKEVVITGLVCDHEGKKMSKSKGNVLDPMDIIDGISLENLLQKRTANLVQNSVKEYITKVTQTQFPEGIPSYGTDALRFTFCAIATHTRVVRFDLTRVEGYRNFCNKLWNAARYVLLNQHEQEDFGDGAFQYSSADRWIMSKLQALIEKTHEYFKTYRFDLLAQTLYEFVWHDYCDWYLEFSKPILHDANSIAALKRGTRRSLITVLNQLLKLLHPIIPFITEALWQQTQKFSNHTHETLMLANFPQVEAVLLNPTIEKEIEWLKSIIQAIRTIRSEMGINPSKPIPVLMRNLTSQLEEQLSQQENLLRSLAKVNAITVLNENDATPISASAIVDGIEILIPMKDLIDKSAELTRLNKEIGKLDKTIVQANNKLGNSKFREQAPEEIIKKEEEKLTQASEAKEKLLKHQNMVEQL